MLTLFLYVDTVWELAGAHSHTVSTYKKRVKMTNKSFWNLKM